MARQIKAPILVMRAKIILLADKNVNRKEIVDKCNVTYETINKWCLRYTEYGLDGLYDEIRPGKPRSISDEKVAHL